MWVKKFLARTLPEAMAQVKAELGPDAVILHTSQVKVGGLFGLFGHRMVSVSAAAERADPKPPGPLPVQATAPLRDLGTVSTGGPPAPRPKDEHSASLAAIKSEMTSMKAMVGMMLDRISLQQGAALLEADLQDLHSLLVAGGIHEDIALGLAGRIRSRYPKGKTSFAEAKEAVRELIRADLCAVKTVEAAPGGRRVIALVGPTGVGKTTTLAKLAAHYALGRRMRVGLVTADTYRVAAVEQLRTYSDILGVPLEVVYDPTELMAAIGRHQNRDLVLVDTAGRSPRNSEHMKELQTYLEAINADETYLVISMTSSYRDAAAVVESYLPLGFHRFIFTKWDEAEGPGLIYNIVHKYKVPLSYITYGQNVPDDIEVANPDKITRAILGD